MRRLRRAIVACLIGVAALSGGGALGQSIPRQDPSADPFKTAPRSKPEGTGVRSAQCGSKTYCREMTSCAEAYFYLQVCGLRRLDADRDGVPCEISHCPHTR